MDEEISKKLAELAAQREAAIDALNAEHDRILIRPRPKPWRKIQRSHDTP